MKIGILGTGHIGKTLVTKLSAAGHDVKVANSRGPETIDADIRLRRKPFVSEFQLLLSRCRNGGWRVQGQAF